MIQIHTDNFLPSNTISIDANSFVEAGFLYGQALKQSIHTYVEAKHHGQTSIHNITSDQASSMLRTLHQYTDDPLFDVHGRHILREYRDLFEGYCNGAGISLIEGVMLQADLVSGCQTIIVQEKKSKAIGLLHTEENYQDHNLFELYQYIHAHPDWNPTMPLPNELESKYLYKIVHMKVLGSQFTFFGYPELCFGGPAISINHASSTFMAVDTINPSTQFHENSLWVNAVASMIFLIGDIQDVRLFLARLGNSNLQYYNGYAIHLAQLGSQLLTSFEIGDTHVIEVPLVSLGDRRYIAQSNFPRSAHFQHIDEFSYDSILKTEWNISNAQSAVEMQRRGDRLDAMCASFSFPIDTQVHEKMNSLCYDDIGDVEHDDHDESLLAHTGLLSPCVASYATGILDGTLMDVHIGKLFPFVQHGTHVPLLYKQGDAIHPNSVDLYKEASTYKP